MIIFTCPHCAGVTVPSHMKWQGETGIDLPALEIDCHDCHAIYRVAITTLKEGDPKLRHDWRKNAYTYNEKGDRVALRNVQRSTDGRIPSSNSRSGGASGEHQGNEVPVTGATGTARNETEEGKS